MNKNCQVHFTHFLKLNIWNLTNNSFWLLRLTFSVERKLKHKRPTLNFFKITNITYFSVKFSKSLICVTIMQCNGSESIKQGVLSLYTASSI